MNKQMDSANRFKSRHGNNAHDGLEELLKWCQAEKLIKSYQKGFRTGKLGFGNQKQFYAPFIIEFENSVKWILFSTTSMRTDRIKGQQWDSANIKELDSTISMSYLVYPDTANAEDFQSQNRKITDCYEYSAIDEIVNQDRLVNLIEEYSTVDQSIGKRKSLQGVRFEQRIVETLNNQSNFSRWKNQEEAITGLHFGMFSAIVEKLGLNRETVELIRSTCDQNDIGKLPSGGNPKTDVLIAVTNSDGSTAHYTVSCKRSSSSSVSVHQYKADDFADVLDSSDENLRSLLEEFQSAGSKEKFGNEKSEKLSSALRPHITRLTQWVLGGIGGSGDPEKQWAQYLLVYDNRDEGFQMHEVHEYSEYLIRNSTLMFGTPFSWTYASKQRGKSIQLKCRVQAV